MSTPPFKTRFAPSPTGLLHLGNIRTALFNYLAARHYGGVFLLRLEDTDAMRGHEKYATALMQDLRWLGLQWDEGPEVGGRHAPYEQSRRNDIYREYFSKLEHAGLAYPCFCSEQELAIARKTAIAAGRAPRYSGKCRALSAQELNDRRAAGVQATLRFRVPDNGNISFDDKVRGPQSCASGDIGDFVIRRSDGTPAFFFCNAIDDALMEVTLVVRGEDHLTNTYRQLMLFQALSLPAPAYAHIALVVSADGAPLSKREGSQSVQELRAVGYLPDAINNYLARLGHSYEEPEWLDLNALARHFSVERLHRAPAHYDAAHLLHWQREAVQRAPVNVLAAWMDEEVHNLVRVTGREAFVDCVRGNVVFPADALHWARILYTDDVQPAPDARDVIATTEKTFFRQALETLDHSGTDFKALSEALKKSTRRSGKPLFQPLRAALTGELDGPEMAKVLPLLGVERTRRRLAPYAT